MGKALKERFSIIELSGREICLKSIPSDDGTTKYYEGNALRRTGYTSDNGVFYLLQDHLHSSSATVSEAGALTGGYAYYAPFGASRGGQVKLTQKRFTGQYHEATLPGGAGLYDYGARWYDPRVGRFITPDSLVPNPANPQDLNRYSYVRNNPLKYTDPSGHYSKDQIMQHFGCSSWGCVQKVFGRGGLLAGLNGWLNVLLKAQDGDSVSALNYQALKSGGTALSTLSGVFMRGEGVGGIQVRLTGLVSPDGANSSMSAVSNSNEFAHFAGNGAVYGSYALAGSGGAAAFGRDTYMRNACDTWDCTSLTLNGSSLLLSAGQTAAVACGPACAGVAGYLTTIDAGLQFAGAGYDLYNAGQYVTGKTSLADATFATVTGVRSAARALSVIPGVGIGWDAAMLAYDIVDPLIPSEQWGSVKGAR